jgi:hypothetical protein
VASMAWRCCQCQRPHSAELAVTASLEKLDGGDWGIATAKPCPDGRRDREGSSESQDPICALATAGEESVCHVAIQE